MFCCVRMSSYEKQMLQEQERLSFPEGQTRGKERRELRGRGKVKGKMKGTGEKGKEQGKGGK